MKKFLPILFFLASLGLADSKTDTVIVPKKAGGQVVIGGNGLTLPEWSSSKTYAAGVIVKRGNTLYTAVSTHTSTTNFGVDWVDTGRWLPLTEAPGSIRIWAKDTVPAGYLECNGQDISTTTYADLYKVLGTTYANQIDPTSGLAWSNPAGFRVPDYRGLFLRHAGTGLNGSATTVGGHQSDQAQGHQHTNDVSGGPGGFTLLAKVASQGGGGSSNTNGFAVDGSNGTPRTGTETRPMNRGVKYIIKY